MLRSWVERTQTKPTRCPALKSVHWNSNSISSRTSYTEVHTRVFWDRYLCSYIWCRPCLCEFTTDADKYLQIERLTFNQQISLFLRSVIELNVMLGESAATYLLHGSLFAIAIGGNDYINNYLLTTDNTTRTMYTPSQFLQLLMSTYRAQLTVRTNLILLTPEF